MKWFMLKNGDYLNLDSVERVGTTVFGNSVNLSYCAFTLSGKEVCLSKDEYQRLKIVVGIDDTQEK